MAVMQSAALLKGGVVLVGALAVLFSLVPIEAVAFCLTFLVVLLLTQRSKDRKTA